MNRLPHLIQLLCEHPELSAARIGRLVDRSPRTVSRYRKAVVERNLPWVYYEQLTAEDLDRKFNLPRYRPKSKTPYDPARVAAVLAKPKATLRDAWEDYRASAPRPHLAYDTFRRRVGRVMVRQFVAKQDEATANQKVPSVDKFVPCIKKFSAKLDGSEGNSGRSGPPTTPGGNEVFGETGRGESQPSRSARRELAEPKISAIRVGRLFEGTRTD